MKKAYLLVFILCLSLIASFSAEAKVILPAIISSDMVLQRNTTVVIWGWANAKEKITLKPSWLKESLSTDADNEGNWKIIIKTTNSKDPQSLKITGEDSEIFLENILFGEVWICSGQSNMQQPIGGYDGQPTYGTLPAIARAENSNLRLFSVDRIGAKTPQKDLAGYTGWQPASPDNIKDFSAIAYFFGQQLQEILDVPVGMIHTSWGGSRVEPWISKEVMSTFQEVNLDEVDVTRRTNQIPTVLFNSMIHPIIPYTIKGALWYQGESNRLEPDKYKEFFPAMVTDWRTRWGIGDFPFYYVQIAPFLYGGNDAFDSVDNSAFIREAQLKCLDLIPNSGIAITMDIGEAYCIHPAKKKEVADRLLYNALNQTYGFNELDYASPAYESLEIKNDSIILSFMNAETGLYTFDGLEGFEIAGEDKVFYPAEASIFNRRKVLIRSEQVPEPVAVRYAWRNWVMGTLFDTNLLPASSFRTDDWEDAVRAK